jgi:3-dehydroquinate dehydratase/shikimate dehydrogenase
LELLRAAMAAGAEFVDLEADAAARIPRSAKTRRIVSHHDFHRTPDDLESLHRRLAALDADVIKITTTAVCPHDNLRVLQLVRGSHVPTVGFCMGDLGVVSRILAGKFGAPWTYATPDATAVAPGQLSFAQMRGLYRYDEIHAETDVYAVIADPVGHSLSPLIHNTAFAQLKLDKVYVPIRVPPMHLAQFMEDAPHLGLKGLSVTIPHKETVIASLGEVHEAVRAIGACNTTIWDGRQWVGYNTDFLAALNSLEDAMGGVTSQGDPLTGKTALLLGAGGVGKAIAWGLMDRKAHVVLCDGDAERAKQLAAKLGCRAIDWSARHEVQADVLVNGTPLGMHPKVDQTPFEPQHMRSSMVVFDAVYNPEHTLLLRNALDRGCRVVSGVDMFVRQACLQFKLFTGHEGPADVMRKVIKDAFAGK